MTGLTFKFVCALACAALCASCARALNPFAAAIKRLDLTPNQKAYAAALRDPDVSLIVCTGPAGTGKTSLAVLHALSELKKQNVRKLTLSRPSTLVDGTNFGALPGGIDDKTAPLFRHIREIAANADDCAAETHNILKDRSVEVTPLEFIRGLTFTDSWIIADEMQNATPRQTKALLTRIGEGSRMVVCGDLEQSDLEGRNGLADFMERLDARRSDGGGGDTDSSIAVVRLTEEDVKRSALVRTVLALYRAAA